MSQPLLLHSMGELASVFGPLVEAFVPEGGVVVEVGVEHGGMTGWLLERCAARGWTYRGIDPGPSEEAAKTVEDAGFRIDRRMSVDALPDALPASCVFLDGDHNRATVERELELIAAHSTDALIVLHDVGWPCARRDFYYDPEGMKPADVELHAWERGPVPGLAQLRSSGFRGSGSFAVAIQEGGGVLTAVESFCAANPGWSFRSVSAVFGLGVLVRDAKRSEKELAALAQFDLSLEAFGPLIEKMERNRIELYAEVLRLQSQQDLRGGEGHPAAYSGSVPVPRGLAMPEAHEPEGDSIGSLHDLAAMISSGRLADRKLLCLDVFDTLLVRSTEPPGRVRDATAERATLVFGARGISVPGVLFRAVRDHAEDQLRSENASRETTLDAVMLRTAETLAGSEHAGAIARELAEHEQAAEAASVSAAEGAAETLEAAQAAGLRVVAVSDMYLEEPRVRALLEAVGLEVDAVYVSAQRGATKHSGELFRLVLAEEGVAAEEAFHAGDHAVSDARSPRSEGLGAVHLVDSRYPSRLARAEGLARGWGDHVLGPESDSGDPLESVASGAVAPVVFRYLVHLLLRSAEVGASRIAFVAREGIVLERLAQTVVRNVRIFGGTAPVPTRVLHASRASLTLPACGGIDGFDSFTRELAAFRGLGAEEMLERCVLAGAGPQATGHTPETLCGSARAALLATLRSEDLVGGTTVLADVGWNATIQTLLDRALRLSAAEAHERTRLVGVYLGREHHFTAGWSPASDSVVEPGVVYDAARPEPRESAIGECKELFEVFLASGTGTTLGYRRTAGGGEAVLAEPDSCDAEAAARITRGLERGIKRCCAAFNERMPRPWELHAAAIERFERFARRPTREEADAVGALTHGLGWGSDERIELAPKPALAALLRRSSRRAALDASAWPTGSLARVPVALRVRGLLGRGG